MVKINKHGAVANNKINDDISILRDLGVFYVVVKGVVVGVYAFPVETIYLVRSTQMYYDAKLVENWFKKECGVPISAFKYFHVAFDLKKEPMFEYNTLLRMGLRAYRVVWLQHAGFLPIGENYSDALIRGQEK